MRTEVEKIIDQALYDSKNSDKTSKEIANKTVSEIGQIYEPIINSLEIANKHNSNLISNIVRLESEIIKLKEENKQQHYKLEEIEEEKWGDDM